MKDPGPGHATPLAPPALTSRSSMAPTRLEVILKPANRRGGFHAELNGERIVTASQNPGCDAARALHRRGHSDHCVLVLRHDGADHVATYGPVGVWRKLRVREDRGSPRFVKWEPVPRRVKALVRQKAQQAERAADQISEPRPRPGAAPALPSPSIATDAGRGSNRAWHVRRQGAEAITGNATAPSS